MSNDGQPGGVPGAPAAETVDAGRLEAFARDTIERYHGSEPIARASGAIRYAKTASSLTEVPKLVAEFFGASGHARGPAGTTVAPAAPVTPPRAPSDTGPPTQHPSGGGGQLDPNPFRWGPEVHAHLADGEFHEAVKRWDLSQGRGNPFAGLRRAAEAHRGRVDGASLARSIDSLNQKLGRIGK